MPKWAAEKPGLASIRNPFGSAQLVLQETATSASFLFLDQPSQAYFPPDTSAETVRDEIA